MKAPGPFQEYAEIWRKNVRVGYGDRFLVEDITGLDYDGNKKKDKVVVVTILDTITKERITFRSDDPKHRLVMSYSKEWMKDWAENQSKQPKRPKAKKSQGAD
jgi:hypothetical protein